MKRVYRAIGIAIVILGTLVLILLLSDPCHEVSGWKLSKSVIEEIRAREDEFVLIAMPEKEKIERLLDVIHEYNVEEWKMKGHINQEIIKSHDKVRNEIYTFVQREGERPYLAVALREARFFLKSFLNFCRRIRMGMDIVSAYNDPEFISLAGSFGYEAFRTGLITDDEESAEMFIAESLFLLRFLYWIGKADAVDEKRRFAVLAWKIEARDDLPEERRLQLLQEARKIYPDYCPPKWQCR